MDFVTQFENDGYVIIPAFFPKHVITAAIKSAEDLVDQFAENLIERRLIPDRYSDQSFDKRLSSLCEAATEDVAPSIFRKELHLPGLFDVFFSPLLLDHISTILGNEIRLYPNYSIRPKLRDHAPTLVLWHQDGGYTHNAHLKAGQVGSHVEILRMVNVWAPLVPATEENGCMQFIPGTHTIGLAQHDSKEFYLEIAQEDLDPYKHRAVSIELNPGDIVLFHNMLYHQGLPNHSDHIRWSMDWRYQDATQSTLRNENGHLARSVSRLDEVVRSPDHWAQLNFG